VYFRRTGLLACLVLVAGSCSHRTSNPGIRRLAVLRFENLGPDPSLDWMGRAFSEIIAAELASAPEMYAIPFERLHSSDASFGARPLAAPGISAERSLALAARANRIGYGDYSVRAGRLEARLTIEDPQARKITQVISASAAAADPVGAASELAHQISRRAAPYGTHNAAAVQAYVTALESSDPGPRAQQLQQAIAQDPNFAPAYSLLAQLKLQQRDVAAAQTILDQALAHAAAMPQLERTKLVFDRASLRGDAAAAERSLADRARLTPNDPGVWSAIAQTAMNHHNYAQAMQAYRKALAIEPEDVTLWNQLGYAAAYASDGNAATQALMRYRALRPSEANPIDSLGDVNLLLGHLREAENFYLQAMKKDPAFLNGGGFFKAAMARLMTGDIPGAGRLDQQFLDARSKAKDPLVDLRAAQWAWTTGHRSEALERTIAFARRAEAGPLRQVASEAYGQAAVWQLALGHRDHAAPLAEKAVQLAGPGSAPLALIARFLSQSAPSATEWAARADQAFPSPAQKPLKQIALIYALLLDKEFPRAASILQPLYSTSPAADDTLSLLLAWADLETGKSKEAAALLRWNPIPSASGVTAFSAFFFPRLFYLRGRLAALAGNAQQAHAQFQLFRHLSGSEPLVWGEEGRAQ
jgi:Tfp pilus assembly protein PilF